MRKRRADPLASMHDRIGNYIRQSLGTAKGGKKWSALLGYTAADLARHLEKQFLKGMTWENMSEWHVDHIKPLSSFSITSAEDAEFRAAWALTNLRPLWAFDNLSKGAKVQTLL
jgi:hypothetical protein